MKAFLLAITFGIGLSAMLIGASYTSGTTTKHYSNVKSVVLAAGEKELILQVADMSEKDIPLVRKNIEHTGGMTYRGYCKKLHVMMYLMDPAVHPDYSFLNTAFMNVSLGYVIKEGTIAQVQNECGINPLSDPNTSGE